MTATNPASAAAAEEKGVDHGPEHPWFTCLVPMIAFLVIGLFEPKPQGDGLAGSLGIPFAAYPVVYAIRVAVTAALLAVCWPSIRAWWGRPSWWPPLLGVALVVPWVILATLQRDIGFATTVAERSGFNPLEHFGSSATCWAFLVVRGLGLVAVVPIIEEVFLRGFFLRFVVDEHFWRVPFGTLSALQAAACVVYAASTHPGEAFAAIGWFAVVSGIAAATRKPVDCILAHAGTNLALGAYVMATGNWWLL